MGNKELNHFIKSTLKRAEDAKLKRIKIASSKPVLSR